MRKTHIEDHLEKHPQFPQIAKLHGDTIDRRAHSFAERFEDMWNPSLASLAILLDFYQRSGKIYRIAGEFGADLAKLSLKGITEAHIPELPELICIDFSHQPTLTREELTGICNLDLPKVPVRCVYAGFSPVPGSDSRLLSLLTIFDTEEINAGFVASVEFFKDEALDDALIANSLHHGNQLPESYIRYVVNCLIYINSGNPDLREYRKPKPPHTSKPKKLRIWSRQHAATSQMDITLVGYNYLKESNLVEGQTTRRGHLRWQHYGEGWSKVKLIWIAETVVTVYHRPESNEPQISP